MKNKFKNFFKVFLVIGLLLFSTLNFSKEAEAATTAIVPTVLVHGYTGGEGTFKTLINNYQKSGTAVLNDKCVVETNGKVKCTNYKKKTKKPLVQVIFKNNKASLKNQTIWLTKVLAEVKKQYNTKQVNIISHSMGGLVTTKYIVDTAKNSSYPKVKSFVTLDSPIKGSTSFNVGTLKKDPALIDLEPNSKAIKDLYNNRKKFPKEVKVFSIVAVNLQMLNRYSSAKGIPNIVGHNSAYGLKDYTKNIKTDWFDATHFSIHQKNNVLKSVSNFVW